MVSIARAPLARAAAISSKGMDGSGKARLSGFRPQAGCLQRWSSSHCLG